MTDITHLINPEAFGLRPNRKFSAHITKYNNSDFRVSQEFFGGAVLVEFYSQNDGRTWSVDAYVDNDGSGIFGTQDEYHTVATLPRYAEKLYTKLVKWMAKASVRADVRQTHAKVLAEQEEQRVELVELPASICVDGKKNTVAASWY